MALSMQKTPPHVDRGSIRSSSWRPSATHQNRPPRHPGLPLPGSRSSRRPPASSSGQGTHRPVVASFGNATLQLISYSPWLQLILYPRERQEGKLHATVQHRAHTLGAGTSASKGLVARGKE
jgi:hypothetical protein